MNKVPFLALLAAAAAVFAAGCECSEAGCAIGTDQGVDVHLSGAIKNYSGNLPVTVHLCANQECADFQLLTKDGNTVCDDGEDQEPDTRACFPGAADLELILSAEMPGDEADVSVTITDANGTVLFEESQTVAVSAYEPNGSRCGPSCRTSDVTFETGPASQ